MRPDPTWPYPYTIEQAFETLLAILETAARGDYETSLHWHSVGPESLIGGHNGGLRGSVDPIASLGDFQHRFHRLLLGRPQGEGQTRWREEQGIAVGRTFAVSRPAYRPFVGMPYLGFQSEAAIRAAIQGLFTTPVDTPMAVGLNPFHPDCRSFHSFDIALSKSGQFSFRITYGTPKATESLYSSWTETVARTRPGESFLDTFTRARAAFKVLVHGRPGPCDLADLDKDRLKPGYLSAQVEAIQAAA